METSEHVDICPCWQCRGLGRTIEAVAPRHVIKRNKHRLAQAQDILDAGDVIDAKEFLGQCRLGFSVVEVEDEWRIASDVYFTAFETLSLNADWSFLDEEEDARLLEALKGTRECARKTLFDLWGEEE